MAEVFLGQRIGAEGFARTVAIKTILALGAEEEGIGLFLDEARVAGYLEHAAIVQTVDLGFENDTLFIVMEYVAGPALARIVRDLKKQNRFLPPDIVAYIGARVASALDYAYRRATAPDGKPLALVHRDISPQNIMLTRTGMVKLTDFGVARASVQTHRTRTGQVRGKAAYMAPEQVRAGNLDGRTDIFALGLVLYESLTGVRVYQRKTDIMSMRAILTDAIPPMKDTNPAVPDDLVEVIDKALAKKPEDRHQTAQELSEALQRTYRSRSEAAIETSITELINELFGPEQFSDKEEGPIESWQPTLAATSGESSQPTPHRITSAKLSPKIAAMLTATPPARKQAAPSFEDAAPYGEDGPQSITGSGMSPLRSALSGTVVSNGTMPGTPILEQSGLSMTVPGGESLAFSEVIQSPTGSQMLPMPGSAIYGSISTSAPFPGPRKNQVRILISVAIGAIVVMAAIVVSLLMRPGERAPEKSNASVTTVQASQTRTKVVVEQQPAHAEVEPVPQPVSQARPAKETEPPSKDRPHRTRHEHTKTQEAPPPLQKPEAPPPPNEKMERERLLHRAVLAKKNWPDNSKMSADLKKLIVNLQMEKVVTADDRALVESAEHP
jgi:serine/threonine-protein kinase